MGRGRVVWVNFVEFDVGSHPCTERFPSGSPVSHPLLPPIPYKFQFDPERTDTFDPSFFLESSLVIHGYKNYGFFFQSKKKKRLFVKPSR